MKKQWKKEDFRIKYIRFESPQEEQKILKFIKSLGLTESSVYKPNNRENHKHIYCDSSGSFWINANTGDTIDGLTPITFKDLFPEEENNSLLSIQGLENEKCYKIFVHNSWIIVKIQDKKYDKNPNLTTGSNPYFNKDGFTLSIHCTKDNTKIAEKDEIIWLEASIKAGKFIPKEEAIKQYNMETIEEKWVKCLSNGYYKNADFQEDKVYKLNRIEDSHYYYIVDGKSKEIKVSNPIKDRNPNLTIFEIVSKPSPILENNLKEEWKLPEKWYIKLTEENQEIVGNFYAKYTSDCYKDSGWNSISSHNSADKSILSGEKGLGASFSGNRGTEITFDQFKQYVLKESPINNLSEQSKFKREKEIVLLLDNYLEKSY